MPAWFRPGDPWLAPTMRAHARVAAAEKQVGRVVEQAVAAFLEIAHSRRVDPLDALGSLDEWPGRDRVWRRLFTQFVAPVLRALFGRRFRATVTVTVDPDAVIDDYLDGAWSVLSTWPDRLFDEVREAHRQALAEGATSREAARRVAELLSITAPSPRRTAEADRLQATIDDPATKDSVRREARSRLAALGRRTDRNAMRWWPQVVEFARQLAVSVLNAAIDAAVDQDPPGEQRFRVWLTALDDRVRPAHRHTHGQVRAAGDMFSVGGFPMRYPGDPVAPADLVKNCRCHLAAVSRREADSLRAEHERQSAATPLTAAGPERGGPAMTSTAEPAVEPVLAELDQPDTPDAQPDALTAAGEPGAEVRWRGVIAPLDTRSADGRVLATPSDGQPQHRALPLPLLMQEKTAPGHFESVIVGNITALSIEDSGEGRSLVGEGSFDKASPRAREVARQVRDGYAGWVSITHDPDAVYTVQYFLGDVEVAPAALTDDLLDDPELMAVRTAHDWRLMDVTMVANPAFDNARIYLVDSDEDSGSDNGADGEDSSVDRPAGTNPSSDYSSDYSSVDKPVDSVDNSDKSGEQDNSNKSDHSFATPTAEKRKRADKSGAALPGGRFPIETRQDLLNAIRAVGRAKPDTPAEHDKVRRHIISRARALGLANLIPDNWAPNGSLKKKGTAAGTRVTFARSVPAVLTAADRAAWCEQVAQSVPLEPPAEWFANPQMTGYTKIRVTDEGRVYGYIAPWGVRHASVPTTAPRSHTGYARFHRHPVRCGDGSRVKTGPLATSGHAELDEANLWAVMQHYDQPDYVVADVVCGEDQFGIWCSGALRPTVTPYQVLLLDRYSLSGDWRDGELIAACAVSVPGFHIDHDETVRALAASANATVTVTVAPVLADPTPRVRMEGGEVVALVAANGSDQCESAAPIMTELTTELTVDAIDPEEWGRAAGAAMHAGLRDAEETERRHAAELATRQRHVTELRRRVTQSIQAPRYTQVDQFRQRVGQVA